MKDQPEARERSTWPSKVRTRLRRFLSDEQGDEGVNKMLILALIAIPLIILLVVFRDKIIEWFGKGTNSLESYNTY